MDWLNTAQQVLTLISGLIGLISAAIGVFFAIRATIQKTRTSQPTRFGALSCRWQMKQ